MSLLSTRELTGKEVAEDCPNSTRFIRVLESKNDTSFDSMLADSQILKQIDETRSASGALLLRGLPLDGPRQAETLLSKLGVEFDDEYLGGASPRSRLSDHFFTSTEAPAPYIISFHTEMCYLRQRPGKIFFYCITEPQKFGETPIFDCAAILAALPTDLRAKIESLGLIYQRYFGTKKARFFNVYKTWKDAFHATDRAEAETACQQQGLVFEWQANGALITRAKMPGVMLDPVSGKKCISLTLYNGTAAPYDLRKFAHRLNPLVRFGLSSFIRFQYAKPNVFMRTLWGDGSEISPVETRAMIDAAWASSNMFHWRQGDLLILDNIRCGHGRLNVLKPRKIAAALGDPYTI